MNFYIDFEATQYSEEIISIGCIREDGQTFYSLVAPVSGKVTPFITNLTGITKEMIADACSADRVFEMFYDWVFTDEVETPEFYCWGSEDINFLRHTFKHTTSMKARLALGYITGAIRDYCYKFSKRLETKTLFSIKKVIKTLDSEAKQNHNALDDAVMLKTIYDATNVLSQKEIKEQFAHLINTVELPVAHKPVVEFGPIWSQAGYPEGTICIIKKKRAVQTFSTIDEAVNYVRDNLFNSNGSMPFFRDTTAKNIEKACRDKKNYYSVCWRKVCV